MKVGRLTASLVWSRQCASGRDSRRLADEYDAAQERGEVRTRADNQYASSAREEAVSVSDIGGDKPSRAEGLQPTVSDIGLTHKEIHEASSSMREELPTVSDTAATKLPNKKFACRGRQTSA